MKQSYYSAFHEMKMFNIKENHYAVFTRMHEEKIIVWKNDKFTPYPQLLVHQATLLANQQQYPSSNNLVPLKVLDKCGYAWASITKEGNVITGRNPHKLDPHYSNFPNGLDSSSVQSQLKNVKMICSTHDAFVKRLQLDKKVKLQAFY